MSTEAALVRFPTPSYPVNSGVELTAFAAPPLDVSRFVFGRSRRGLQGTPGASVTIEICLEEPIDVNTWTPRARGSGGVDPKESGSEFLGRAFRLRWFRMRNDVTGDRFAGWAEGLVR